MPEHPMLDILYNGSIETGKLTELGLRRNAMRPFRLQKREKLR
jgi:hypothetical protein